MSEEKRIRRTPEQMAQVREEKISKLEASVRAVEEKKAEAIAAYDEKIAAIKARIESLREPKKPGRKPTKKRRTKAEILQTIVKQAQKAGLSPDEIAQKLGVSSDL